MNTTTRNTSTRAVVAVAAALAFVATVVLANYLTTRFGFVPVGFGLSATAGTFIVGVTLALRDVIQDAAGRRIVLAAVAAGAILSFVVSDPHIAAASCAAFLISELLDLAVYTPLRARARFGDRRWSVAVLASTVVGAITDTVVFVGVAFGPALILPAMPGQLVGKLWATVVFLVVGWGFGRALFRKPVDTVGA